MSQYVMQKTVFDLLSSAMFQIPFCVDKDVDWKAVFDECKAQSVISLAFSSLPKNEVPQNVYAHWKALVNENLAVNSKISYTHQRGRYR